MEQNYIDYLKKFIKAGNFLIDNHKNKKDEWFETSTLLSLIRIEGLLDSGRKLANFSEYEDDGSLDEINSGMEGIRSAIVEIMKEIGKDRVQQTLLSHSEEVKTNFFSVIWKE